MPSRLCPRCHAVLHTEDTGDLTYCSHCGAAQIALSEELREQFEQQQLAAQQPADGSTPNILSRQTAEPPISDPTAVDWPRTLQLVALASGFFFILVLLALALQPLSLLAVLWILGAPIILLGIYAARNPATRITAGFGSRLGLLSGLSAGIALVLANTLAMATQRFVLHQGATLDSQFSASMAQTRTMLSQIAPSDPAAVQQSLQMLTIPEFHAGAALLGCTMLILLYSLYSAVAGAFSGALRSRSAARSNSR